MFKVGDRVLVDWNGDKTKMVPGVMFGEHVSGTGNRLFRVSLDNGKTVETVREWLVREPPPHDSFNQQVADYCQRELGRV